MTTEPQTLTIAHANINRSEVALFDAVSICLEEGGLFVLGICEIPVSGLSILHDLNLKFMITNSKCAMVSNCEGIKTVAGPKNLDILGVSMHAQGRRIGAIEGYWRPWVDTRGETIRMISSILETCLGGHKTYIMGDWNTEHPRWSFGRERASAKHIMKLMNHWKLSVASVVDEEMPTFVRCNSVGWLDAIFCVGNSGSDVVKEVRDIMLSDHKMIKCKVNFVKKTENARSEVMNIRALRMMVKANPLKLAFPVTETNIESNLNMIIAYTTNLIRKCSFHPDKSRHNGFVELIREKKILRRKLARLKSSDTKYMDKLCSLSVDLASCKSRIHSKIMEHKKLMENRMQRGDIRPWEMLSHILGKEWHQFRRTMSTTDEAALEVSKEKFMMGFDSQLEKCRITQTEIKPVSVPPNESEWAAVIKKLGKKLCKYSGYTNAKGFSIILELQPGVRRFINECIMGGWTCNRFFMSRISLIEKANGKQVRPLGIMHSIGKAFECCALRMLMRFPGIDNLPHQQGFTRKKGSAEFFLKMMEALAPALKDDPVAILVIVIDQSNAFENFSLSRCKENLITSTGDVGLAQLIINMLDGRQCFIENGDRRVYKTMRTGSFQGGYISPLLYNIATADVGATMCGGWKLRTIKYADDLVVISEPIKLIANRKGLTDIECVLDTLVCLQVNIEALFKEKCRLVDLEVNESKTKSIIVTNSARMNRALDKNCMVDIMGLQLRSGLLKPQIARSAISKLEIIRELFERKINRNVRIPARCVPILYDAMVNSLLRYYSLPLVFCNRVDALYATCNRALRRILGASNSCSTDNLRWLLGCKSPARIVADHALKIVRNNGISEKLLSEGPPWMRQMRPPVSGLTVDLTIILADSKWLSNNEDKIHWKVAFTREDLPSRCRLLGEWEGNKQVIKTYHDFVVDASETHSEIQALLEVLEDLSPTQDDVVIMVRCPWSNIFDMYKNRRFGRFTKGIRNRFMIAISDAPTVMSIIEQVGCPNVHMGLKNLDLVTEFVSESFSPYNKRMKKCFRHWTTSHVDIDRTLRLCGEWRQNTKKKLCACRMNISANHLIFHCKKVKRPQWIEEAEPKLLKASILKCTSTEQVSELEDCLTRGLRMNGIRTSTYSRQFTLSEITGNVARSYYCDL